MATSVQIFIKRPTQKTSASNARKRFSIFKRTIVDGKKLPDETIESNALDTVNNLLNDNEISLVNAEKNVKAIVIKLKKEQGLYFEPVFNNDNNLVLKNYWNKFYKNRDLVDAKSMQSDFNRALRACGNKSILSASQEDLQQEINTFFKGKNEKQRRAVSRLNQLLKFISRDFQLMKLRPEKRKVRHLSPAEFDQVIANTSDTNLKLLLEVLFYTGSRIGEAFGIEKDDISVKSVFIDKQIDKFGTQKETKNNKERHAFLFKEVRKDIYEWVKIKDKITASRSVINKTFKKICRETFDDSSKHCTLHDLRHSYAINLISRGVSLSLVAQSLGNSVLVCEKFYTGFILSSDAIEFIDKNVG